METMRTLKDMALKTFKGIGIWVLLIFFNTGSGQPMLNLLKMILNVMIAIMFVSESQKGKKVACGMVIVSTVVRMLHLYTWIEICLFVGYTLIGGMLLYYLPESEKNDTGDDFKKHMDKKCWKACNRLNPLFEKYTYSKEDGLKIKRGIINTEKIPVPIDLTNYGTRQNFLQTILGLCDVKTYNFGLDYVYEDKILHNVSNKAAKILIQMLH